MGMARDREDPFASEQGPLMFRPELYEACLKRLSEIPAQPTLANISEYSDLHISTLRPVFYENRRLQQKTKQRLQEFLGLSAAELNPLLRVRQKTETPEPPTATPCNPPRTAAPVSPSPYEGMRGGPATTRSAGPMVALLCIAAIGIIWIGASTAFRTAAAPALAHAMASGSACMLDLRLTLPEELVCAELGTFTIGASEKRGWNTRTSGFDVPDGWVVIARYEYWMPPAYEHYDENRHGFVPIDSGSTNLDDEPLRLYEDHQLERFVRHTDPPELNDAMQYLMILRAGDGEMRVRDHRDPASPDRFVISRTN